MWTTIGLWIIFSLSCTLLLEHMTRQLAKVHEHKETYLSIMRDHLSEDPEDIFVVFIMVTFGTPILMLFTFKEIINYKKSLTQGLINKL